MLCKAITAAPRADPQGSGRKRIHPTDRIQPSERIVWRASPSPPIRPPRTRGFHVFLQPTGAKPGPTFLKGFCGCHKPGEVPSGLYSGPFLDSVLDRFGIVSAVMEISIHRLLDGATRAIGTVAIIDVFRAFTTAAVALANGASKIVMVRAVEEALALREDGIGQICMGEVRGRAADGFNFGNSPFEISRVDFGGKTIIQRTSAGTQGIVAARQAKRLYATSLVTADATGDQSSRVRLIRSPWSPWATMG